MLDRRSLLAGLGGSVAAPGLTIAAAAAPIIAPDKAELTVEFFPNRQSPTVAIASLRWVEISTKNGAEVRTTRVFPVLTLEARAFGPRAGIVYSLNGAAHRLEVVPAAFGRLDDQRVAVELYRAKQGWTAEFSCSTFAERGRAALKPETFPNFEFEASAAELGRFFDRVFDGVIRPAGRACIAIDKDGTWTVRPKHKNDRFAAFGEMKLGALRMAWVRPETAPSEQLRRIYGAQAESTVPGPVIEPRPGDQVGAARADAGRTSPIFAAVVAETPDVGPAEVRLGGPRGARVIASGGSVWFAAESYTDNRPPAALLAGLERTTFEAGGVESHFGAAYGVVERRRSAKGLATTFMAVPGWRPTVGGRAAEDRDSDRRLQTALGRFSIRPHYAVGRATEDRPRLRPPMVARALDDRLELFDAPFLVTSASIALANATYSRLDFDGEPCRFVYGAADPRDLGTAGWVRLDDAGGVPPKLASHRLRLPLDTARLRASRASDLAALVFRFHALDIVAGEGRTRVVQSPGRIADRRPQVSPEDLAFQKTHADWVRNKAEGKADGRTPDGPPAPRRFAEAADGTKPILVVEFPPQHLAERAYFRQDVELPQVLIEGEQSGADGAFLDKIRPETPEARRCARLARQVLKIDTERLDGLTTFAEFAKRFGEIAAPALGPRLLSPELAVYIGPEEMDPDEAVVARLTQKAIGADRATKLLRERIEALGAHEPDNVNDPEFLAKVIARERAKATRDPMYGMLREHFRASGGGGATGTAATLFASQEFVSPAPDASNYAAKVKLDAAGYTAAIEAAITSFGKLLAEGGEQIDLPAPARLSGRTRLAFRVDMAEMERRHGEAAVAFDFDALTDWQRFDLSVVRRAEKLFERYDDGRKPGRHDRREVQDVGEILRFQGLGGDGFGSAHQRLADIYRLAGLAPNDLETAIELPSRLELSPAQDATFITPERVPEAIYDEARGPCESPRPVPLWRARLDRTGPDARLRAVASPDFRPGVFLAASRDLVPQNGERLPGLTSPPRGPVPPWTLGPLDSDGRHWRPDSAQPIKIPFWKRFLQVWGRAAEPPPYRLPLDAYDRHELVAASSVYGLPVIGRRGEDGKLDPAGDQFEPPPGFELNDVEAESAIYRPRALDWSELSLSALGGSIVLDTSFSPPYAARLLDSRDGQRPLFDSFSIERWRQTTLLGRDITVEVVYKGFLFPLGHRASLVKLTERQFVTPRPGGPVSAVLIQRMFIKVSVPEKRYPAVGQPIGGRQWPPSALRILTTRTPDIIDPMMSASDVPLERPDVTPVPPWILNERARIFARGKLSTGLVFWPKTGILEAPFAFELDVPGEAGRVSVPLLFVDNVAAGDPVVMAAVAHFYENAAKVLPDRFGGPKDFRRVQHGGAVRRYAEARKSGDTSFKTNYWLLGVHGTVRQTPEQVVAKVTDEALTDDGFVGVNDLYAPTSLMVGADQPPFYPRLVEAQIQISQVERFTGRPAPAATVRFDGDYLRDGFPKTPPGGSGTPEIYLDVAETFRLAMGDQGDRAGALARPDSYVFVLSRLNGPMGGSDPNRGYLKDAVFGLAQEPHIRTIPALARRYTNARMPTARRPVRFAQAGASDVAAVPAAPSADSVHDLIFGDDYKLLGLVSLKKLIAGLLDPAGDQVPRLVETLGFGVASEAENALEVLRRGVLVPLQQVVAEAERTWKSAELDVGAGSGPRNSISISELYPEVGTALERLSLALAQAIAAADVIRVAAAVSAVHDAARGLLATIESFADDPLAALDRAARQVSGTLLADLTQTLNTFTANLVKEVKEALKALGTQVTAALIGALRTVADTVPERFVAPLPAFAAIYTDIDRDLRTLLEQAHATAVKAARSEGTLAGMVKAYRDSLPINVKDLEALGKKAVGDERRRFERELRAYTKAAAEITQETLQGLLADPALGEVIQLAEKIQDLAGKLTPDGVVKVLGAFAEERARLLVGAYADRAVSGLVAKACPAIDKLRLALAALIRPDETAGPRLAAAVHRVLKAIDTAKVDLAGTPAIPVLNAYAELVQTTGAALAADLADATRLAKTLSNVGCTGPGDLLTLVDAMARILPRARSALDRFAEIAATARGLFEQWRGLVLAPDPLVFVEACVAEFLGLLRDAQQVAVLALRDEAIRHVDEAIADLNAALGSMEAAARPDIAALVTDLNAWVAAVRSVNPAPQITAAILALEKPAKGYKERLQQLSDAFDGLGSAPGKLAMAVSTQTDALAKTLSHLLVPASVSTPAAAALRAIAGPIAAAHDAILAKRNIAYDRIVSDPYLRVALQTDQLLVDPPEPSKSLKEDKLAAETKFWDDLSKPGADVLAVLAATPAEDVTPYLQLSKPVTLLKRVFDTASRLLRGDISGLVDLQGLKQRIEEQIKYLVPTSATLSYDFDVPMKEVNVFQPAKGARLTIRTRTVVDLLEPSRSNASAEAKVGAFDILLLPDFNAVRLMFDGATCTVDRGASPEFKVRYRDFEIGDKLAFLQGLQSILTPKAGSGFFLRPLSGAPGIEAGYKLDLGGFSLGNVTFLNINLYTSIELPFSNREALFKISLGTRRDPFLISYAPYGGGGFFSLTADSSRIVEFEAAFEFGGMAAYTYGPLTGVGRVMSGFYIRKYRVPSANNPDQYVNQTEIYGTFFCGGSASVWIFSVAAALSVMIGSRGQGMFGIATFSYAFSIGFAKFKFSVSVERSEGQNFSGGGDRASLPAGDQIQLAGPMPRGETTTARCRLVNAAVSPAKNFATYARYFDASLGQPIGTID
ncbi:hypothetical protein WBG79_03440 [Prosthecomicrobium sp. N25]